jgi:hypothetical protein
MRQKDEAIVAGGGFDRWDDEQKITPPRVAGVRARQAGLESNSSKRLQSPKSGSQSTKREHNTRGTNEGLFVVNERVEVCTEVSSVRIPVDNASRSQAAL